jgi:hypothetical protein
MSKIIEVKTCGNCPFAKLFYTFERFGEWHCTHYKQRQRVKTLVSPDSIPKWCKLRDKKQTNKV